MFESDWIVYKLVNPLDDQPFYIGITGNLRQRVHGHVGYDTYLRKFIRKKGKRIKIEAIRKIRCSDRDALKIEQKYIRKYRKMGYYLENKIGKKDLPKSHSKPLQFWTTRKLCFEFMEECYRNKIEPNDLFNTILYDRYFRKQKTTK